MKLWKPAVIMSAVSIIWMALLLIHLSNLSHSRIDSVDVNDIVKNCSFAFDSQDFSSIDTHNINFTVLDNYGNILHKTPKSILNSINDGIHDNAIMVDILNEKNTVVGKVIFDNSSLQHLDQAKSQLIILSIVFTLGLCLFVTLFLVFISRKILTPFSKLQNFSANIARGNFDSPLLMDKKNIFGAFTESFDIMRDELLRARENERCANQSKKELVAALSHDIKTPVSSIIAVSEVMLVKSNSRDEQDKLKTIITKAEQINALISNMFHATLQELQTLTVNSTDISSIDIIAMIENTDYQRLVTLSEIPDCILHCDPLRLQQVFDNIVGNSYKYADTSIDVSCKINDNMLDISFTDYGKGIPEDELPLIFGKFYRGENSQNKNGAGLGLYISHYVMTKMDGTINAYNTHDGFRVVVSIKLS